MMAIEQDLLKLKRDIESLVPKRDRAKWEHEQAEKEALEKYKCKTPEQLEKKASKEEKDAQVIEAELKKSLDEALVEFKDLLDMV